jgi:hypothetical protein
MSLTALVKTGMIEKAAEDQWQNNFLSRAVEAVVDASGVNQYSTSWKPSLFLTLPRIIVGDNYHF